MRSLWSSGGEFFLRWFHDHRPRGAGWAWLLVVLLLSVARPISAQGGAHQAGLVVVHGDGRVLTRCVAFDEPQITGSELLSRSGLSIISTTGPLGQTICSLNGEGCPANACWCECTGTPCVYWVYHNQQPDGSWAYANLGAVQRTITDGDVDAWVWGENTQSPPPVSFETICGAAGSDAPPPTPPAPTAPVASTVTPTMTAVPTSGATAEAPIPTATATPGAPRPTATALPATPTSMPTQRVAPSPLPTASPSVAATEDVDDDPLPAVTATTGTGAPTATAPALPVHPEDEQADLAQDSSTGLPVQYLAFSVVLGVIGLAFVFLSDHANA